MIKMNKLISIIVPVYNSENYVEACINSVLKQTYQELEVILINDGSTDQSGEICERYKKIDKRVKVIHTLNQGIGATRNLGLSIASGEYLMFVDSDDMIDATIVEELYTNLVEDDVDLAICNFYHYDTDREKYILFVSENDYYKKVYTSKEWFQNEYVTDYNISQVFSVPWGKLYKRELFENIRYPLNQTSEDDFTTWKIYLVANKISFMNKALYMYRKISNSQTKQLRRDQLYPIEPIEQRIIALALSGMDISRELKAYRWRLDLQKEKQPHTPEDYVKLKDVDFKRSLNLKN